MDLCVDVLDGLMSQLNSDDADQPDASVKVKRKGILQLFTGGVPKFQKSLVAHRLHVCCVLFHEDRVLMTNDDALPMVVVDEALPAGGHGSGSHYLQHVSLHSCQGQTARNLDFFTTLYHHFLPLNERDTA